MHYNELIERLRNLTGITPVQSELMQILNIKQSTMSERARRNSRFTPDEIKCLNNFYGINLYTVNCTAVEKKAQTQTNSTGGRLKAVREALSLKQEDFAHKLGVSCSFINSAENDKCSLNINNLTSLLTDFNVNINYLLSGTGSMFIDNVNSL